MHSGLTAIDLNPANEIVYRTENINDGKSSAP
jgi:hypothetical protein